MSYGLDGVHTVNRLHQGLIPVDLELALGGLDLLGKALQVGLLSFAVPLI